MPAPKDQMLRFTNAMPVLVRDPTLRARKAAAVAMIAAPRDEVVFAAKEAVVDTEASENKTLRRRPPKPTVSKGRAKKKKQSAQSVGDGPADEWAPEEGGESEQGVSRHSEQGEHFNFDEAEEPAIRSTSLEDLHKECVLYLDRYKTWTISEYLKSMNLDSQERQSVREQDVVMRDEILPAIKSVLELVSSFAHDELSHEDVLEAHLQLAKGCHNLWVTANRFEESPRIVMLIPRIGEVLKRLSEDHAVDVVYAPEDAKATVVVEATPGNTEGSENAGLAFMAPDEPGDTAAKGTKLTPMEEPIHSDVPLVVPGQTVNDAATGIHGPDDAIVALDRKSVV
jgi:hypothetical protein